VKRLLDLIRTSCKGRGEPIPDVCRVFNARTEDGRRMERYSDLLSQAIRSIIEVKEEKDIDSLFGGGRTTALTHTIKGLDDFELIAFLVIEGGIVTLYDWPRAVAFYRVVPKTTIYEHAQRWLCA